MTLLPHLHVCAFPRNSQHCQHCIHLAEDQTSSSLCSPLSVMQFQRSQVRATNGVAREGGRSEGRKEGAHVLPRSAWVHLSTARAISYRAGLGKVAVARLRECCRQDQAIYLNLGTCTAFMPSSVHQKLPPLNKILSSTDVSSATDKKLKSYMSGILIRRWSFDRERQECVCLWRAIVASLFFCLPLLLLACALGGADVATKDLARRAV